MTDNSSPDNDIAVLSEDELLDAAAAAQAGDAAVDEDLRRIESSGAVPVGQRAAMLDRAADAIAIERLFPELRTRLRAALGWNRFGDGPGPAAAIELYFSTGHSAIIKGLARNPFANPLAQSMGIAHSASQECCA